MFLDHTLIESIILQLPNYVFVKDENLVYRLCNLNFAKVAEIDHPKNIIGKTDYDMPWGKYTAEIYLEEDRMVLQTGKPMLNREVKMITPEGEKVISVSKSPLYSQNSKLIGILGIYIDVTEVKRLETKLKEAKKALAIEKLKLTLKEQKCIELLLLGKTVVEIARIVSLSPRTIECRVNDLKNKFGCFTKSELIATLFRSGFEPALEFVEKKI